MHIDLNLRVEGKRCKLNLLIRNDRMFRIRYNRNGNYYSLPDCLDEYSRIFFKNLI